MIAEVIVNSIAKSLNREFHYIIPEEFEKNIKIGKKVLIPFGKMKKLEEAFVIGILEKSEYAKKEIVKIENDGVRECDIILAKLMARKYFCNISDCIKLMSTPGSLSKNINVRVKDKKARFVYLKKETEEIEKEIEIRMIKSPKQIRILQILIENDGISTKDLEMFADIHISIIKTLEKNGYLEILEQKINRNPFENKVVKRDKKLELTEEQKNAYDQIKEVIENKKFDEFLLYGITGSGKTEIYLQAIEEVIKKQKTAIVLVPEISLTPQMTNRFLARFGDIVAILHSKLSIGERYDEWNRIKEGKVKIVIGARSAIFAPIENLGIVIIDEEHDSSYKSESTPKYDAKEIARYLCKQNNIPLILGSATPNIGTYYKAQEGKIKLLQLTKRANHSFLPNVEIVDLREELANGNKSMISRKLYSEMQENVKNKKQTILFLNRRGYSSFVMCRECGYTAKCKNCNISLTYHRDNDKLKCHYCGYEIKNIKKCPQCNSDKIKFFGVGTQKLEMEIKKIFPEATVIRLDTDTVAKKNSYEEILSEFRENNVDILIGTQMIVKGHHFPNVTLVGVIAADGSLNIDDYRANEITFQLLTQVAGRAGRENNNGQVIIQTYNPDNFSIECSKNQDFNSFYESEINIRKLLKYPPFCDIILFGINSYNEKEAQNVSYDLYQKLVNNKLEDVMIYKPLPAPINKIKNKYRWRIVVKCNLNNRIIDYLKTCVDSEYHYLKKETNITIDINPNNML